jgi:hypothetical protein
MITRRKEEIRKHKKRIMELISKTTLADDE